MCVVWHICAPLLGTDLGAFCHVGPICIVGGWVSSSGFLAEVGGLCVLVLDHCVLCQLSVGLVHARFVSLAECPLGDVGRCCKVNLYFLGKNIDL